MPTLLFTNSSLERLSDNEKSSTATSFTLTKENQVRRNLEQQLKQGSIRAAVELSLMMSFKHDVSTATECYRCDKLAKYYLAAFRFAKNAQPIECNPTLLQLVQQAIELVQSHADIGRVHHLPWLPMIMDELRELCKQIKEESRDSDRIVPLPLRTDMEEEEEVEEDAEEEEEGGSEMYYSSGYNSRMKDSFARAIRISIYHCRASFCEDLDSNKAITYYRKCLSVRPSTVSEAKKLQSSAKVALRHLIADRYNKYAGTATETRPHLPSRTSSVSSGASSSCSMACANCGVEKRGMPVCSKCKSTYYCTVRCLKAHKAVHDLECNH
ncbi:hypothetical protein BDF20DRAFT_898408 [Mycotypha africana]|uniref:uncharacterized protein n=1 Tax=Mycotypha africana TaxID=64632 RepID=UPI0023000566|nr:uncharacterized protein BDF20DRAFT_898408 [Mycotypha africana]KAI8968017.1 hypothetical protein BDF20DRAFT_898408 [Mycotypha africana]